MNDAVEKGARIFDRCRVDRIRRDNKNKATGVACTIDNQRKLIVNAAFPDVDVNGGNELITELDRLMMTFMRANREFEYAMISLIFGIDRLREGEYMQEYKKGWTTYFW